MKLEAEKNEEKVPEEETLIGEWAGMISKGFFAEALETGKAGEIYKAAIRFAAIVRRSMSDVECRRVSVELILEAEAGGPECDDG